ncbi:MAG TPA: hypothetical protein VD866_04740, partial [Urbifossiella sp.]|nr:hypothetical protein [Urbifossiella sp.]
GLTDPSALPFTPDGSPENLRYHAADAWEALNDVLDRLACAVKLDHVADTFSIVRLGDAAAAGATALTTALAKHDRDGLRSWDAYHAEPNRGRLPETVRVLFPRRPVPTDGGSPYFAEDVTLAATAGVAAGTYVQLFDDLTAVGEGTPTNAAALTTRAEERAADWRRKRLGFERRLSLVYRDFRPDLVPGETVDQTALDDRGGPMTTVLEARPDGKLEAWRPFVPPIGVELTAGDAGRADCQKVMSGLLRGDCLVFRRRQGVGWCANVTQKNGPAAYHPESKCWVASTTFLTHEGRLATMYFYYLAVGLAGMAIVVAPPDDAEEGTEPDVYVGKWMGCVDGGLSFSFSDAVFCSGEVTGGCEDNYFRVWVACRGCAAPAQVCARSVGNPFPGVEGLEYLMTCHGYAYGTAGLTPTATGYHFEYVASGATYPVGQVGIHCSQVGCNTTDGHGWGVVTEADYTPDGGWVFTNPAYAAQAWSFDPFYLRVGFDGGTYFEAFGGACTCGEATGNQPQSLHYSGSPTSYGLEVTGAGGTLDALNDAFRLYYSTITVLGGWVDYGADFVTVLSVESGPYAGGGDPVYRLTVWDEYPSGTELAVFEKPYADWVVCGSNTLGLVHTAPGGTAPETVTVEPSGICYECRKGSGCGVADCDDGSASGERSPGSLVVDASGGGTTDFADIDAKYGLAWVDGTATWTGTGITLPLGYPAASYTEGGWAAVATRTAGTWTVVLSKGGTSATYSVSGLSTDCGENVGGIPLTSQVGTGTPPATVTITPCSGAGTTDSSDGYCPAELMMMAVAAGFRNADGTVPLDLR